MHAGVSDSTLVSGEPGTHTMAGIPPYLAAGGFSYIEAPDPYREGLLWRYSRDGAGEPPRH